MGQDGDCNSFGHKIIHFMIVDLRFSGIFMEDNLAGEKERQYWNKDEQVEYGHGNGKDESEEYGVELDCIVELPVEFVVK